SLFRVSRQNPSGGAIPNCWPGLFWGPRCIASLFPLLVWGGARGKCCYTSRQNPRSRTAVHNKGFRRACGIGYGVWAVSCPVCGRKAWVYFYCLLLFFIDLWEENFHK